MILDHLNRIKDNIAQDSQLDIKNWHRINYYEARNEEVQFPDNSLIEPLNIDEQDDVENGIKKMIKEAFYNGITQV